MPPRQRVRRTVLIVMVLAIGLATARPVSAYLKFGFSVNGSVVTVKWRALPVRYFINDRGGRTNCGGTLTGGCNSCVVNANDYPRLVRTDTRGGTARHQCERQEADCPDTDL